MSARHLSVYVSCRDDHVVFAVATAGSASAVFKTMRRAPRGGPPPGGLPLMGHRLLARRPVARHPAARPVARHPAALPVARHPVAHLAFSLRPPRSSVRLPHSTTTRSIPTPMTTSRASGTSMPLVRRRRCPVRPPRGGGQPPRAVCRTKAHWLSVTFKTDTLTPMSPRPGNWRSCQPDAPVFGRGERQQRRVQVGSAHHLRGTWQREETHPSRQGVALSYLRRV